MRRLRALFHEETALLSVRKFPFPEQPPNSSYKDFGAKAQIFAIQPFGRVD
jgi:hypothetical protein